ncbi:MAG TPA: helix-turn-helix transcriptional regulator [Candidatus Babeliaceae bacterium]|nr:helix-turn-helix transcriptional regulator [Candidatus Babeliaceae bacterium]
MSDLTEMVKRYTIKYDRKIKSICAPLEDFGISYFYYFKIEENGNFFNISNHPETCHFYFEKQLYQEDPYFSHPHLLRSGYLLAPDLFNPTWWQPLINCFRIDHFFCIFQVLEVAECFGFVIKGQENSNAQIFLDHFDLLLKFTRYFKKEAKDLIGRMETEGFNIKKAKGDAFFKVDPSAPLCNSDPNIEKFLKLVLPLSRREMQCLELFKQGRSAQATGAILGISSRTVESYFESIKNKLGCHSKAELLEW